MKLKMHLLDSPLNEAMIYDAETGDFSFIIQYHHTPKTDGERLQNWVSDNADIVDKDEDGVTVHISQLVRDNWTAFVGSMNIEDEYEAVSLLALAMSDVLPITTKLLLEALSCN